jgi:hypothetical protein
MSAPAEKKNVLDLMAEEIAEDDPVENVEEDDDDDCDDEIDDADAQMSGLLYSLLTTEDDESITNVLKGIRDGIDKQNKILYKILTSLAK